MIYIWIVISVLSILGEILFPKRISVFLMPGALLSLILSLFPIAWWIQLIVFICVSALLLLLLRPVCLRSMKKRPTRTSIDAIIGERCVVTERIENLAGIGQVEVNGMYWAARSAGEDTVYEIGETLSVVAVEGVKVIVRR